MIRFYRKHHAARHSAALNSFIYASVLARMSLIIAVNTLKGWR